MLRARHIRELLVAKGLGPKTVATYLALILQAERFCSERGTTLGRASALVVAEFAETKPFTWSSRKLVRSALGHYWTATRRRNPPLGAIRVPPKPEMECRALEPNDATMLAKAARARADHKGLAVLLALYLGLRRAEIAALRWDSLGADGWCRLIGKGGKAAQLPMHPILVEALAATPRRDPTWVFPGRPGVRDHVAPATIWWWVREVSEAAGVGKVPPHPIRHTCLAQANDVTGNLRAVQQFARHSRPETTSGYTRTRKSRLVEVMQALDY